MGLDIQLSIERKRVNLQGWHDLNVTDTHYAINLGPSLLDMPSADRVVLYGAQSLDTTYEDLRWPSFATMYFKLEVR